MSGHSKWSTIKRRKGAQDAKRGKLFTKVIKEITIAARSGGGDPDGNARLRRAVDLARSVNMPAENVSRAIKKGTGELEGVQYEELLYEGVGPDGTLFVCEVVTDNRNRTIAEVRKLFDKNHGQISSSGSALWAFEQRGIIRVDKDAASEEQLFEAAVGGGAENLELVGDEWVVTTPRNDLDVVRDAILSADIAVREDHDDVQNVYSDFELSEQALAEMA